MRMFGFVGNRADLAGNVLAATPELLTVERNNEPVGWGVGFYQAAEVLLRRRPLDDRPVIDLTEVTRSVKTNALIAHVRTPTVGKLRTENTHPFRYRHWMFAQTSTIGAFQHVRSRLLESLPEFLRKNVRGDTDAECLFFLVLSFLHDAGQLDAEAPPSAVRSALKSAIALADRMSQEEGAEQLGGDLTITNGDFLITAHLGGITALRVLRGKAELEGLLGADSARPSRRSDLETAQFCLIASNLSAVPASFTQVEAGTLVTLTPSGDPEFELLQP